MGEVIKFLKEAKVFYIATVEQEQPRVRPFGAVIEYEGKIYLTTNNEKKVYRQLVEHPEIEISAMNTAHEWIRLHGKAVIDDRDEVKEAMLNAYPNLKEKYKVGDGKFEVFYIDHMKAFLCSFNKPVKEIF